jgi:hypothetical protein
MTQQEHLQRIRQRCVELLEIPGWPKYQVAGWKSTIAAIDGLYSMPPLDIRGRVLNSIIAAWPEELL